MDRYARLALLLTLPTFASGEERFPNLAATSDLSKGAGLAAKFKSDHEIAQHPAVIFADNFETGKAGGRWAEKSTGKGDPLSLVPAGGGPCGERCLRVTATLGVNEGGGMTQWFESADSVFIRFYTRFDQECDYVHHFVTLRANKGLSGKDKWSGFGGAGNLPKGDDRFSTALEPWGNWGKSPAPGKWNFYSYWPDMKAAPDGKYWGNQFQPKGQDHIVKGLWVCAEFMLKHNTLGKPDGEQAYWIDGKLIGHWKGINWRTSKSLKANALTLESYVTDRWTKQKVNIVDFDNLVIAREYIGPAGE